MIVKDSAKECKATSHEQTEKVVNHNIACMLSSFIFVRS
jgi:hypothetical protein